MTDKPTNRPEMVYGFHAIEALIRSNAKRVEEVRIDSGRKDKRMRQLIRLLERNHVRYAFVHKNVLSEFCGNDNHQGVVGLLSTKATFDKKMSIANFLEQCDSNALVLVLDHIQDPRNLGACIRSADGAGVDAVVLPKDGASPVTDTVRKVSSGAVEATTIISVANLVRTISELKDAGFWVYGADDSSDMSLYDCQFPNRVAIILGEEGEGLRRLTRESCDQLLSIPMKGSVSSLNVSVATGVMLYEVQRQGGRQL